MDLTKYRAKLIGSEDERAVSPVIGVILMVAITVILAAVIAAFVLDMGDMGESAPNANFEFEENDAGDAVTITHTGGESIQADNLVISDGTDRAEGSDDAEFDAGTWEDEVSAGDSVTIGADGDSASITDVSGADTIQVIWEADGNSQVLDEYEMS